MLTDYTTFDDIRSALGVSPDEIEDGTLGLETWDNHLVFDLEEIGAALPAAYAAIAAITPASSRTAVQVKLHRSTRLFATLSVANALTASLSMFGPKDIGDGKAIVSRFSDSPYKETVKGVKAQYTQAQERLKAAWGEFSSSTVVAAPRSYMGVSSPDFNPVTGV